MRKFVNTWMYNNTGDGEARTMGVATLYDSAKVAFERNVGRHETIEVEVPPGTKGSALGGLTAAELRAKFPIPMKVSGAISAYTLPVDSEERKNVPVLGACVRYFPAALAGVAKHSKAGNDKHNKGQPLQHARWKSTDHEECIQRHLIDMQDIRAFLDRHPTAAEGTVPALLSEANALCWRALALSQELHEKYAGAPLAPAATVQS